MTVDGICHRKATCAATGQGRFLPCNARTSQLPLLFQWPCHVAAQVAGTRIVVERWPLSQQLLWTGRFAPPGSRAAFAMLLADDLVVTETAGVEDVLHQGCSAAWHPLHGRLDEQICKKAVWYSASHN
eukprot:CAMPEP_0172692408 /NCGR_PEP_ID=MMETSP1074-20121228/25235_1 /TAXON_ID=2916 /ORGANISM="Ceratium fusus, Strain PA161109" /LENGTH=127 /DNA_ID=CAMNT_0013512613 /DNA_START=173 /DNA_END=553 /DNA_ORIENTATION=+